ncbi:protein turtle homolog A isoform X2 [Cololabis saira]|uniref:protein turtle homolog A isoform X2 n=1 Tax=Cololabis saira TaxID=129043 RepID=UPI002AD5AB77|nr:protein turtle homolog A isoform X2 [Cololabis saira]
MGSTRSYWQTVTVVTVIYSLLTIEGVRTEVRGKAGGTVNLECVIPPSDPAVASQHVVEWIRQGLDIPVLIKFGSYAPRVHPHYEGRVSLVRVSALRLERLQLDDEGSYECRILSLDRPTDEIWNSTWTVLSVTAPPTFTKVPPPVLEALVGAHLLLSCVATGNPIPTITWLKDGNIIQSRNDEGEVLSLPAVSTQSAGLYTCHASNTEGNVTRVTKIMIKGPPVIIVPPKNTSLNMSQDAFLQCQAVADPPNMTYVWQKKGQNVHHIESLKSRVKIVVDGTLLISSLIPEDSGNYTCVPTNGLLTPPAASAILTVMHPAQALHMPRETYLPIGMDGVVRCPVAAEPPLLRVDWMKDGEPLDLSLYPGWTLKADGSLLMATVNEDAAGTYMCAPYNSYGSMGSSVSTTVILQDPPSFSITPEKQYKEEVGRKLLIPCQGSADPTIKVTWSKVDLVRRISYAIEPNGSLLLQPVIKDHQGAWECSASNRVASAKTRTRVFVLGTSPHAATSLSVSPGVREANISWKAGFDGGSAQTFSVWVKKISANNNVGKQDWFSVPVPPSSDARLQVSGLSPATDYQFSILSQNKIGAGPFSEIATARTLDPPRSRNKPKPPASLSANQDSAGVLLQWSLPESQQPPITGFVLQAHTEDGEWFNLDEDISANSSKIVVPGLRKDRVYELRLLSRHGVLLSEPSASVNVSTSGTELYATTSRLLEFVPEQLLAVLLGGVGFVCLALVLLLGTACVIHRKRKQRRKKKKDEPLPAIYKCSPSIKTSGSDSPDSLLKKSLLPASPLYPTTSSTTTSSSLHTDSYSFSAENHHPGQHIMSNSDKCHSTKRMSLISTPIELISRGPDGRFTLPPYENDTLSVDSRKHARYDQYATIRRSNVSLDSEKEDRKQLPFVLSVDFPPCKLEDDSTSQMCDMDRFLPRHTPHGECEKGSYCGFPDLRSLCSNSSLDTMRHHNREMTPAFPVLPHIKSSLGQQSTTASNLVLQMEHDRERGNLNRCLKLAQEREELERKLQRYTLERNSVRETKQEQVDIPRRKERVKDLGWECKSRTLPHGYRHGFKESSHLSPRHFLSSSVHWEAHPFVSQPTLIPSRNHLSTSTPSTASCFKSDNHPSPPIFQCKDADNLSKDCLTLPHLSSKYQGHERAEGVPKDYDNATHSTVLEIQMNDSHSEGQRQKHLNHGSFSTSFQCNQYKERCNLTLDDLRDSSRLEAASPESPEEDLSVEMSVDEPNSEFFMMQPKKPMLHHRIASHVQHGCTLVRKRQLEDTNGSTNLNCHSLASVDNIDKVLHYPQPSEQERWRAASQGSNIRNSKQRSQSLDLRRLKQNSFLAPDAWVDSLSQENGSDASSCHPHSLFWKPQISLARKLSKHPKNSGTSNPATLHSSPPVDHLSPRSSPLPHPDVPCHYEPKGHVSFSASGATNRDTSYIDKDVSVFVPPDNNDLEALEVEAGDHEEASELSGSYSSYASSGRGSMETANGRLSLCQLSPTLIISPETVLDPQTGSVERHSNQEERRQRRKPSVDENYEWDTSDFCSQPGDHDRLQKTIKCCNLASMQSTAKAQKNCTEPSPLPGRQSSCSAEAEPAAVLF